MLGHWTCDFEGLLVPSASLPLLSGFCQAINSPLPSASITVNYTKTGLKQQVQMMMG